MEVILVALIAVLIGSVGSSCRPVWQGLGVALIGFIVITVIKANE